MPKSIWKYPIRVNDAVSIEMPIGAVVLHVQAQNEVPCLWALVDPLAKPEVRRFRLAGTGHTLPDNPGKHVGTFFIANGMLVWHLFETFT